MWASSMLIGEKNEGTLMVGHSSTPAERFRWELCQNLVKYLVEKQRNEAFQKYLLITSILCLSLPKTSASMEKPDFNNFSYKRACCARDIEVRHGKFKNEGFEACQGQVVSIETGKLGNAMASGIWFDCAEGGNQQLSDLLLFLIGTDGTPAYFDHVAGGDRANGGIANFRFEKNKLIIEAFARAEKGAENCNACKKYIDTSTYQLNGASLQIEGKSVRRLNTKWN